MNVNYSTVSLETATGGGATGYSGTLTGKIASVEYIPGATGVVFASTADFTITSERTGETIWSESNITAAKTVRPLRAGQTSGGATPTGASLTEPVLLYNDRIKFVVAQGGNTKAGSFGITVI